jgi:hypothetical protein
MNGGDVSLEGCEGSQRTERRTGIPWIFVKRLGGSYHRVIECVSVYENSGERLRIRVEQFMPQIPELYSESIYIAKNRRERTSAYLVEGRTLLRIEQATHRRRPFVCRCQLHIISKKNRWRCYMWMKLTATSNVEKDGAILFCEFENILVGW